jgi:hypothetical protein
MLRRCFLKASIRLWRAVFMEETWAGLMTGSGSSGPPPGCGPFPGELRGCRWRSTPGGLAGFPYLWLKHQWLMSRAGSVAHSERIYRLEL